MNKNNETVLITGANRGIGLALCKHYLKRGAHVIAVCRKSSKELQSLFVNTPDPVNATGSTNTMGSVEIIDSVDVSLPDGVERLKKSVAGRSINILINNAGILRSQTFDNLDYKEILQQFEVNALGPIRVVEALFGCLSKGSKIAMITSRMGSVEDNTSGGSYGYRMSKCALNIAGKSMAMDFKQKGISVALLHPGYVQTEMVNFGGEISAELSAERLAQRIDGLNIDNTGTFWHSNGEVLPW